MDEATQEKTKNWLKRADEYLGAAELELSGEFYARSISTAYYAMFYAAAAALTTGDYPQVLTPPRTALGARCG